MIVKVQLVIRNRLEISDAEFPFRQNGLVRCCVVVTAQDAEVLKNNNPQQVAARVRMRTRRFFQQMEAVASGCTMRFTSQKFYCRNPYRINIFILKRLLWYALGTKASKQTNSVALGPQANYTDRVTATCRRNLVSTFADRGVSRGQRGGSLTVVNLSFLDRSRYFSFK
jgi:hypothetical protein